jgi:hypothetical protein
MGVRFLINDHTVDQILWNNHQAKADDIRQSRYHHCPLSMSEAAPPVPDPGAVS